MLSDPSICRERALECERLSQSSLDQDSKRMFADMAIAWRRVASELESTQALIKTWDLHAEALAS